MFIGRAVVAAVSVLVFASPIGTTTAAHSAPTSATLGAKSAISSSATTRSVALPQFWFPFHDPVKVGCVVNNCGSAMHGGHHFWAIDFSGQEGTPLYAAASGIAHVGGRSSCAAKSAGVSAKRGNWLWIDHGKGRYTEYRHLRTILVRDKARVTPTTRIGRMGHTGVFPCKVVYTHFEYVTGAKMSNVGRPYGKKVSPGPMLACVGGARVSFPQALNSGNSDWNAMPGSPPQRILTPATGQC